MKPIINQRFLRQTQFDSAAPFGTAVVAHELKATGSYELAVAHEERVLVRLPFGVADEPAPYEAKGAARQGAPAPGTRTLAVDLAKLTLERGPTELPSLTGGGWVSITSSRPLRDHHVLLRRRGAGEERRDDLDSRRLGARSLFGLTLIRPGRYSVVDTVGGGKAEIVVAYPVVGDVPYRPPEPLQVTVGERGFEAGTISLLPAQGIVFRFRGQSRLQIELVEPDDGPAVGGGRKRA